MVYHHQNHFTRTDTFWLRSKSWCLSPIVHPFIHLFLSCNCRKSLFFSWFRHLVVHGDRVNKQKKSVIENQAKLINFEQTQKVNNISSLELSSLNPSPKINSDLVLFLPGLIKFNTAFWKSQPGRLLVAYVTILEPTGAARGSVSVKPHGRVSKFGARAILPASPRPPATIS